MPKTIDINTDELISYTKKLEDLSKNKLRHVAMRTLNDMAFDVKKRTLADEAGKAFTIRNKAFYKRFSKVQPAKFGSIDQMYSEVGMNGKDRAVQNQKQQMMGGRIDDTAIPFDEVRTGRSNSKMVKNENRIGALKGLLKSAVNTKSINGSRQRKYVLGVVSAAKRNQLLIHKSKKGQTIAYRVKRGGPIKFQGSGTYQVERLYNMSKGRSYSVDSPKPVLDWAARRTQRTHGNAFFIKNAKRFIK